MVGKKPFVVVIVLVIIFVIIVACSTSPTGRKQLLLVSDDQIAELGKTAFKDMKQKGKLVKDPKVTDYVNCVAVSLLNNYDRRGIDSWEIQVFEDPTANAFALPGKRIGVHTGMLKVAKNASQLAAVIGHEIGHVQAKHGAERMSVDTLASLGTSIVASALQTSESRDLVVGALGIGAQYGVLLPYSREQETEADIIGLEMMAKAGFYPEASVELWVNMSKLGGSVPEFLSTHPSNQRRIATLNKNMEYAKTLYQKALEQGKKNHCVL